MDERGEPEHDRAAGLPAKVEHGLNLFGLIVGCVRNNTVIGDRKNESLLYGR